MEEKLLFTRERHEQIEHIIRMIVIYGFVALVIGTALSTFFENTLWYLMAIPGCVFGFIAGFSNEFFLEKFIAGDKFKKDLIESVVKQSDKNSKNVEYNPKNTCPYFIIPDTGNYNKNTPFLVVELNKVNKTGIVEINRELFDKNAKELIRWCVKQNKQAILFDKTKRAIFGAIKPVDLLVMESEGFTNEDLVKLIIPKIIHQMFCGCQSGKIKSEMTITEADKFNY